MLRNMLTMGLSHVDFIMSRYIPSRDIIQGTVIKSIHKKKKCKKAKWLRKP